MHVAKLFVPAVAVLAFSVPALAQQQMGSGTPSVDDQVNQLDAMVDLDEGQKVELSNLLTQMQDEISGKEQEAQQLQQQLGEQVQADYDEAAIRVNAERLGDLTAEMTADSVIIQSQIEGVFTQEQRAQLDEAMAQQQQQMQQQMQEQMQQQGG